MSTKKQYSYYELLNVVRYGDIIKVIGMGYYHFAVFIGYGMVIEIQKFGRPQVIPLEECLNGRNAFVEREELPRYEQIDMRLNEVLQKQEQYNLLLNNCEHVARYVATGRKDSKQASGWVVAACLVAIFAM